MGWFCSAVHLPCSPHLLGLLSRLGEAAGPHPCQLHTLFSFTCLFSLLSGDTVQEGTAVQGLPLDTCLPRLHERALETVAGSSMPGLEGSAEAAFMGWDGP
jgi:hypothetical protein